MKSHFAVVKDRGGGLPVLRAAALFLAAMAMNAAAAVYVLEDFTADPTWGTRGWELSENFSSAGYYALIGNPSLSGSFGASFGPQDVPSPQTDAIRISGASSSGDYASALGKNYFSAYSGFIPSTATFSFHFYSDTVAPSDLRFFLTDSLDNTYGRSISGVTSTGSWQTVTVNLDYNGWIGGDDLTYSNLFTSLSFIDIQITRNDTMDQSFFVDNFSLNYQLETDPGGGGEPGDAIPEPGTTQFLVLGLVFLSGGIRRRLRQSWDRLRTSGQ